MNTFGAPPPPPPAAPPPPGVGSAFDAKTQEDIKYIKETVVKLNAAIAKAKELGDPVAEKAAKKAYQDFRAPIYKEYNDFRNQHFHPLERERLAALNAIPDIQKEFQEKINLLKKTVAALEGRRAALTEQLADRQKRTAAGEPLSKALTLSIEKRLNEVFGEDALVSIVAEQLALEKESQQQQDELKEQAAKLAMELEKVEEKTRPYKAKINAIPAISQGPATTKTSLPVDEWIIKGPLSEGIFYENLAAFFANEDDITEQNVATQKMLGNSLKVIERNSLGNEFDETIIAGIAAGYIVRKPGFYCTDRLSPRGFLANSIFVPELKDAVVEVIQALHEESPDIKKKSPLVLDDGKINIVALDEALHDVANDIQESKAVPNTTLGDAESAPGGGKGKERIRNRESAIAAIEKNREQAEKEIRENLKKDAEKHKISYGTHGAKVIGEPEKKDVVDATLNLIKRRFNNLDKLSMQLSKAEAFFEIEISPDASVEDRTEKTLDVAVKKVKSALQDAEKARRRAHAEHARAAEAEEARRLARAEHAKVAEALEKERAEKARAVAAAHQAGVRQGAAQENPASIVLSETPTKGGGAALTHALQAYRASHWNADPSLNEVKDWGQGLKGTPRASYFAAVKNSGLK